MPCDIDSIIAQVRRRLPAVAVTQMHKSHPGDDDGIWWFRLPNVAKDIQIESSSGNCPFIVEHDDMQTTAEAITATSVAEVVENIVMYLERLI
jgi:hypothetical protein